MLIGRPDGCLGFTSSWDLLEPWLFHLSRSPASETDSNEASNTDVQVSTNVPTTLTGAVRVNLKEEQLLKFIIIVLLAVVAGCEARGRLAVDDAPAASNAPRAACVEESPAATGAARARLASLQRRIPAWLREHDVPSVAVTYVSNHAIAWTLVCGERGPGKPATLSTLYNTASIAKPIVGEIVLRLASHDRVSLDEPMSVHWLDPDLADDPRHRRLTPRIALAHQTGFENWRRMSEGRLRFEWDPGTDRGYSGEGIRYVVRFLEHKLGTPFENLAREVLFDPAGMNDASFVREPWFSDRVAWRRLSDGSWAAPALNDEPLGAGDVWTTSADYARYLLAVMSDRGLAEEMSEARRTIARDEVARHCGPDKTPIDICPRRMGFSVGWYVYQYEDHTLLAHNGANTGEKTLALVTPESGMGLAVFANGENGKAVIGKIARALYDNERFMTLEGY